MLIKVWVLLVRKNTNCLINHYSLAGTAAIHHDRYRIYNYGDEKIRNRYNAHLKPLLLTIIYTNGYFTEK